MLLISPLIRLFCRIIIFVLHLLYFIYLKLKLIKPILKKVVYMIKTKFYADKHARFTAECVVIEAAVRTFPKLPKHLVLAVGEEHIYYKDLIQIILWCLPTGISVFSIYDHKNELNPYVLYDLFAKEHKHLLSNIKWGVSFDEQKDISDGKPLLQINVLSSKHGRQLIIDVIKELATDTNLKLEDRKSTEIAIDRVMERKLESSPDPDLMVICGDYYTSFGISPWHIGFTEFALTPSYRLLTVNGFIKILRQYAYCAQNFGT